MTPKKKKKKKSVKKFNLAKAVKKVARDNTMGLNLSEKDHGDKTQYERKEQKKRVKEEIDESL
ncbi:MAG: hypothetical protein A2008_13070 [Candidatus Wallbacteria bacterium GWC2_49_35]|jgi:hypothetical protein|uniref:Uncharacterized protein n=1 Tax=Candidatus Wallbacteria bacterium GWC2_49_35 TaxID=1817813 RepID=A0A1F7WLT9_9BACT|nr:MAG: hypothetical protein A2008_13070 [Candidatus Wallbacteria bacterium GWC2_49_35]HBC74394.1 hypothetical protein [Candidatus Wallbacteria bacterium]